MKTIFPWLVALVLAGVCVYLWNSQEEVYISGEIMYDTVRVENPINEKLELEAETFYYLSQDRLDKIDSLRRVLAMYKADVEGNENIVFELEAIIELTEGKLDSIAKAKFELGNYEGNIVFRYNEKKFEFDYEKAFDVYVRERTKPIGFGISCYVMKQEKWGLELGVAISFQKIIKGLYFGVRGNSFGGLGVGLDYKL